ncbi:LysR substrate-binding domain-containing protein [Reyranella sp. CPCC 100927]|uniref:LysR substrate-binding domain-containing protein n=1 Tax=Reyranella sp. CPCC 100927 TaxID=2599616 RepID=UPI0015B6FB28|nr:LysR substrate-binding domain-containing protein [Reyranella sp. CPCC 100927]
MLTNFDLATLRSFALIARGHTFAETATAVGRSQPAVSLQIRRLEASIGAPIFHRGHSSVTLTLAGQRLLPYAQRLIQINDEAVLNTSQIASKRLRVGITLDLAESVLPQVLSEFRLEHPDLDVTLCIDDPNRLIEAARGDQLDLAIGLHGNDGLSNGVIAEAPMIWIGKQGFEPFEDGLLPLALCQRDCSFRTTALHALGIDFPFRVAATSSSLEGILAPVRAGICITVRTRHLLAPSLADVGAELNLPTLPNLGFCFYAPKATYPVRDDLIEICRTRLRQ